MPKLVHSLQFVVRRKKQKITTNYQLPTTNSLGFTLIELLVVIAIIAVLATIGFVNYQQTIKKGRDARRQADLRIIQAALEQYHADNYYYPPALTVSGQFSNQSGGVSPAPTPLKIYLNSLPVDPQAPTLYTYTPTGSGCSTSTPGSCTGYCLYTTLETASSTDLAGGVCAANGSFNYAVTRP